MASLPVVPSHSIGAVAQTVARFEELSARQAQQVVRLNELIAAGARRLQEREEQLALVRQENRLKDDQIAGQAQEIGALREQERLARERLDQIGQEVLRIQQLKQRLSQVEAEIAEYRSWSATASRGAKAVVSLVKDRFPRSIEDIQAGLKELVFPHQEMYPLPPALSQIELLESYQQIYKVQIANAEVKIEHLLAGGGVPLPAN